MELEKALNTIHNYMDGEVEVWITQTTSEALDKIKDAMFDLALINAVYEEEEESFDGDLWTACCKEDKEFKKNLERLEKVNVIV